MRGHETGAAVFRFARFKVALMSLGAFVFAAACGVLIHVAAAPQGSFKEAVVYFGVPFFALMGVLGLRSVFNKDVVVTISPDGIKDTRLAPQTIPWSAIQAMTLREMRGQRFIMLDVDPSFERTMKFTRITAWTKPMNAAIGFEGLVLNPGGLDGTLADLIAAIEKFTPAGAGAREPG